MLNTIYSNSALIGTMNDAVDNYLFLIELMKTPKTYGRLPAYTEAYMLAEIYYNLFSGYLSETDTPIAGMTIADLYNQCVINNVEYSRSVEDLCFDMETWKSNYCNYKYQVSRINMNNAIASFPEVLKSMIFASSTDKDLLVSIVVDEFDSTLKGKAIAHEVAELIPDSVMKKKSYSLIRDAIMQIINAKV